MTFQEALVAMNAGQSVTLHRNSFIIDDGIIIHDDNGTNAILAVVDYASNDWEVAQEEVLPTLEQEQVFMYFHPEKNRWVSTTNPQKHLDDGEQVAVFKLDRAV